MIVITNPVTQNNDLTWVLTTLDLAIQEVVQIIEDLIGKTAPPKKTTKKKKSAAVDKKKTTAKKTSGNPKKVTKAELPKTKSKGSNGAAKPKTKAPAKKKGNNAPAQEATDDSEVHEFWKAATLEEEIQRIDSPDSLSFEQAQKLGFIPDGENGDS